MNTYSDSIAEAAFKTLSCLASGMWSQRAFEMAIDGGVYILGWERIALPEDSWVDVSLDYARLGSANYNIIVPMSGVNFDKLAAQYDCALPTEAIVRATWTQSGLKLPARSMIPSIGFESARTHSNWADSAICKFVGLVAGHKKDVIYAPTRTAGKLAIFGWQGVAGIPVQPLNTTAHSDLYYDYSHGLRLVKRAAQFRGQSIDYLDAIGRLNSCKVFCGISTPIEKPRYVIIKPSLPNVLQLGSKGSEVVEWQRQLNQSNITDVQSKPIVADGQFGLRTLQATNKLRDRLNLAQTGVVDDVLRYKLSQCEADPQREINIMPNLQLIEYDPVTVKFVQAKGFNKLASRKIDLIVMHTMEAPVTLKTAENVASWFNGPSAPKSSAHYCVDPDSIVQCVADADVAWHAPGANNNGIGIEHAGYAKWTRSEWLADANRPMLARAAGLLKHLAATYNIPLAIVTESDLRAGNARGITTHAAVSKAYGKSNHWDPGTGFPLVDLIDLAASEDVVV